MRQETVEDKIQRLHSKAKMLAEENLPDSAIIEALTKEGIDEHYAYTLLENVRNDQHDKKEFRKHLLMGSFVTIAGLLVNYLSYKFLERMGAGQFLLIWGVVVFGIVTILRGFILFRK